MLRFVEFVPLIVGHSCEAVAYFNGMLWSEMGDYDDPFCPFDWDYYDQNKRAGIYEMEFDLAFELIQHGRWRELILQEASRQGNSGAEGYFLDLRRQRQKDQELRKSLFSIRALIERGADMADIKEQISSILALAMPDDHRAWKDALIDNKGMPKKQNINENFYRSQTMFQYCCKQGFRHLVVWLLESDAVSKKDLQAGFVKACKTGNGPYDLVLLLVRLRGPDIGVETVSDGLCQAARKGHIELVRLLLQDMRHKGGDPNSSRPARPGTSLTKESTEDDLINVLTQAVIFYVGDVGARFEELVGPNGQQMKKLMEEELEGADDARIEDDLEGADRLPFLQLILQISDIDANNVLWNCSDIRLQMGYTDTPSLSWTYNPWKRLRVVNAMQMLVAAGASARKMFEVILALNRVENFLTVEMFRFYAEEGVDIQFATRQRLQKMLDFVKRPLWKHCGGGHDNIFYWDGESSLVLERLSQLETLQKQQAAGWQWIDQLEVDVSLEQIRASAPTNARVSTLKNRHGREALHIAAACNRRDVAEWLVSVVGVNPDRRDEEGRRAVELAVATGSHDVEVFLLRHVAQWKIAKFGQSVFRMRQQVRARARLVLPDHVCALFH
jgi:ankyrin repeat protein